MAEVPEIDPELLRVAMAADESGEIRDQAGRLVTVMLGEIERQMVSAPANQKHALMQKVLPVLMKMGEQNKADEQLAKLRAEMDDLQGEIALALLGGRELTQADLAPEDAETPPEDTA